MKFMDFDLTPRSHSELIGNWLVIITIAVIAITTLQ